MPFVAKTTQLADIFVHGFTDLRIEHIHVRNVLHLIDRRIKPAFIQPILIEILANVGKVTLGSVVMPSISFRPSFMILGHPQIALDFFDQAMCARPVVLCPLLRLHRRHISRDQQTRYGKRKQFMVHNSPRK